MKALEREKQWALKMASSRKRAAVEICTGRTAE